MVVQRLAVDVHPFMTFNLRQKNPTSPACDLGRPSISNGRTKSGRACPPVTIRTFNIIYVDVHQCLYGRTTCGRGRPPLTI